MRLLNGLSRFHNPRVLLILIPLLVYANSLTGEFVYDDREITVENNPALTGEASIGEILQWDRPLREFTYMLDHALWGWNPLGYHMQNLVWHIANVLLFHALLIRLGIASTLAFWCALIFSIHPIGCEAVAWISGRKELLCLFFELSACLFFLSAYRHNRLTSGAFQGCLVSCALALLSKQVAAALPLLIAVCIGFYHKQNAEPFIIRKFSRFLAAPCLVVAGFVLFQFSALEQLRFTQEEGVFYDPAARGVSYTFLSAILTPFATFLKAYGLYLWPLNLSVEYSFSPVTHLLDPRWIVGALLLSVIIGLALRWINRYPAFAFGVAWFFVAWAPVSGAAPVAYLVADRYLYIPCLGFCLAATVAFQPFLKKFETKIPYLSLSFGIAMCLLLSIRSVIRNADWHNELSLWTSAARSQPQNPKIHAALASAYADRGETDSAFQAWNRSLELDPNQPRVWVNRGNEEKRRGNAKEAEDCYRNALELFPTYGAAHFNLALLLEQQNRLDEALRHFQLAAEHLYHRVNTEHRQGLAHYHIARLFFVRKELQTAAFHLSRAEKLAPAYAPIHLLKGLLSNDPQAARKAFKEAIRLDPNYAEAYFNLGVLEWQSGNPAAAEKQWQKAAVLDPSLEARIKSLRNK